MNRHSKILNVLRSYLNYNSSEKQIRSMMGFVSNSEIEGDYIEFGVYAGFSLISAFHFAKWLKVDDMKFYGFDSFEGLPKEEVLDKGKIKQGDYSCPLSKVEYNLKKDKCDISRIKLIKGWFKDVKIPEKIKKAAIINFDCDYYSSTRDALKLIKPLLQEGTMIRFDDWGLYKANPTKGQRKAFSDFKKTCKDFIFEEYIKEGGNVVFLTLKKN
jgi:hypothetical protein